MKNFTGFPVVTVYYYVISYILYVFWFLLAQELDSLKQGILFT